MTIEESGEIFTNICMGTKDQAKLLAIASGLSYQQAMAAIISALVIELGNIGFND